MARRRLPIKTSTSVRFSADDRALLRGLCVRQGVGPSHVMMLAIRALATREKVTLEWARTLDTEKTNDHTI